MLKGQSVAVFDVNDPAAGYQILPIAEWADVGEFNIYNTTHDVY